MAGTESLEGKVLIRSLSMLNTVTDVLDAHSISYSLDAGTALGVIREARLLPWDTDMDIAIDSSSLGKIKPVLLRLFLKGYRIRIRRLTTDAYPVMKGSIRVIKVWRRKWLFFKGPEMLDIFVRYKKDDLCYWILGGDKRSQRVVINSMPSRFHDNLKQIQFNNKLFYVAEDDDAFLTYRYGDWRTPVKKWDAFINDGAIQQKS